jgi:photosystem II stability/assembly factor-like uncharacterized protein
MKKIYAALAAFIFPLVVIGQSPQSPSTAKERMDGIAKRKTLEENSLVKNLKFRNVGPSIMSGRAVDVDVNPEDPSEFYVAYASGGLWYTKNNGQSFTPMFDHEDVITIGDIAVDWKTRHIWIGTGEANSSRSSYAGNGIYESTDTGKTWLYKGLPESHHIGKIILNPDNPKVIWVAALGHLFSSNKERGVYKSSDDGQTWKQVLFVDDTTGAIDLAMDPSNSSVLYASMWHRDRRMWNFTEGGKTSGIYKTTDGGDSWTQISKDGSGFPSGDGNGRIGLAVYPKNSKIIYAVLDNQAHKKDDDKKDTAVIAAKDLKGFSKENFLKLDDKKLNDFLHNHGFPEKYSAQSVKELVRKDSIQPAAVLDYLNDANNSLFDTPIIGAEVYRSDDAGSTWKKVNNDDMHSLYFTYGYYFGKVFVSPVNPDKIILCGYNLLMSLDGGKSFKTITADNTHPDYHAVWMNPKKDDHMIICNDGGLNITYDNGVNWYKANSPSVGQFYSVNVDMEKPYNVYGGLQDNGVWYGPSTNDENKSWHEYGQYPFKFIDQGDGMQVQVDTRDNNIIYEGTQFGYYSRTNKRTEESKSIKPQNDLGKPNYRFNWQTPIWLSRHNQDILYMGTNHFHRSMNKGDEMQELSDDLTLKDKTGDVPFNTIVTICESPMKFGLLYAGTDDGLIWLSKDDGYTWKKISDPLPKGLYVTRVTASAFKEGTVYVSLNGCRYDNFSSYLFLSEDFGNTWKQLGIDLPAEPINVVKEDPKNENILYAGTDNGIYLSLNKGKIFMAMNGNMPRVAVHDLVIHPRDNDLVLGTHGRSIFIANLDEVQQLNDSLLQKSLYVFSLSDPIFNRSWGKKYDPFTEQPHVPSMTIPFYAKENGVTKISIRSEKGLVLHSFTDTTEKGLNYVTYNLEMDSSVVKSFEKSMTDKKKNQLVIVKQADDKKYYLLAGNYSVDIADSKGNHISKTFTVKKGRHEEPAEDAQPQER